MTSVARRSGPSRCSPSTGIGEGVIDTSVREACRSDRIVSYRRVRLSTFGRLRAASFVVLAAFDHPHFTLVLATSPG